MCAAVTSKKTSQSTTATITSNVANAVMAADSTTAQSVQNLGLVHQARLAQVTRKAASVIARYGKNSPQAKAAEAAVAVSKATVARIAVVSRQTTSPQPQVTANGWALYGHIYHSTLQPASAYTVFFVDQQNAYQSSVGFAYTGSDGSFQINYPGTEKTALPQLFLEVVNDKAQPVFLSTTAFQPQTGKATYQDVTLPVGEPVLGDPPPDIRSIAMPNTPSSSTPSSQGSGQGSRSSTPGSRNSVPGSQGSSQTSPTAPANLPSKSEPTKS